MPLTTRFEYERSRDLTNLYEASMNPRIGAQIRSKTSIHDARTQHREVVPRGTANRRPQGREQLQFIAELVGGALDKTLIIAEEARQEPILPDPGIANIPARALAEAPNTRALPTTQHERSPKHRTIT
ncbi:hypothetical protein QAD02_008928 [Eretmocerus hayati]|uniref:Uncharacterized protein n=1 Tax=Eretmocerus hayati TaxID=131215 RepID=A0ACC2N880_9HYME|nr:hypothetical protein QAD02_008928 [Eretmocerus hayati]